MAACRCLGASITTSRSCSSRRPMAELAYAFMRSHPAEAAQVIEGIAPDEAAALFAAAPAHLGAAVLAAMLPAAAARVVDALEDERAMALLAAQIGRAHV